ncbi:MAG: hypothetical protein RIC36_12130 [Rhodospirillales bacterium]
MMPLVWIHEDALGVDSPAVKAAPKAPRVIVLDDAFLAQRPYGMKRLTFIYESALACGAEIWRGPTAEVLLARAKETGCDRIIATTPVAPDLKRLIGDIRRQMPLDLVDPPPLVILEHKPDMKRFSRFWKIAEASAVIPTAQQLKTPSS